MGAGFVMQVVLSPVLEVVSFGFAPQSTLAPLNGLALVWNTLLAPFTLGESLTANRVAACSIITASMVAIALVGKEGGPETAWNVAKVEATLYRWGKVDACYAVSRHP